MSTTNKPHGTTAVRITKEQAVATEEMEETSRSAMHVHNGMVAWLKSEQGIDLNGMDPADILATGFAWRNRWRKSDQYHAIVEEYRSGKTEREAEAKAAKEAAKAEKAKERDAAKAAKDAERAAAKAEREAAKTAAAAAKAEKAAKAAKADAPKEPTKATKKTSGKAKGTEDPFA